MNCHKVNEKKKQLDIFFVRVAWKPRLITSFTRQFKWLSNSTTKHDYTTSLGSVGPILFFGRAKK